MKLYVVAIMLLIMPFVFAQNNAILADKDQPIAFNAAELFPDIAVKSVLWDFADNTNSTEITANHTYIFDGVYNTTVVAVDNLGNNYTANKTFVVGSIPFVPPEATYVSLAFIKKQPGLYTLTVLQSSTSSISTSGHMVGSYFFDITSDMENNAFNVTATFNYDDEDNDSIVDNKGINEASLGLYYFNGGWIRVDGALDTTANRITAELDHFTTFALLSTSQTAPSPSPSGGGSSGGGGGGGGGGSSSGTATRPVQRNVTNTTDAQTSAVNITQPATAIAENITENNVQETAEVPAEEQKPEQSIDLMLIGVIVGIVVIAIIAYATWGMKNKGKKKSHSTMKIKFK